MNVRCLECTHEWDFKGAGSPRCPKCGSVDIINETEYQEIIEEVRKIPEEHPRIRLAVLRTILENRGLRLQPHSTLNLVEAALDDVFPEASVGMTVLEDGSIYYHKRRVKRRRDV